MNPVFQGLEKRGRRRSKAWKTPAATALAAALAALSLCADTPGEIPANSAEPDPAAAAGLETDTDPELWFAVGEELVFTIYWSALPVGETRCTSAWVEEDGRRLIHLRFRTRTNKVLSTIFPVDDVIESFVDPATFLPLRFVKNVKEGKYRYHETTTFDWEAMEARWESHIRNETKIVPLEPETRDIPTLMYWVRRDGVAPGVEKKFRVWADDKIHDIEVPAGALERLKVGRYGKMQTVKIEPKAAFGGVAVRKGRLWIWVTQDPRYLAAQISVEVPVARVHLVLDEVQGPGDDFWVRKRR